MVAKKYYWKNPEKFRAETNAYRLANPEWHKESNRKWAAQNRKKDPGRQMAIHNRYRDKDPARYLLLKAARRAASLGVAFNLTAEDVVIPEFCPVLGIKIEWGVGQRASANRGAPSLDRIIGSLGYIKGNVRIISNRANHLKNNAEPEELMAIAAYATAEHARVCRELAG
jgi:hypothetical protein